jgi:hypothetical protein
VFRVLVYPQRVHRRFASWSFVASSLSPLPKWLLSSSQLLLACVIALAVPACGTNSPPGTQLGTFKVVADTQTNSCGLSAPNPWTFDVQLSQDGTTLYWNWMDGSPYLTGTVSGTSTTIVASEQVNVDGTGDGGLGPCTMERDDTLQVDLPAGSGPSSFTGSIGYAFAATAGSNCSDQLTASAGQYETLPCTITYTVTATKQ